ncbi:UNVERIFIED_CONTAM: hypothetical protein FKN15_061747 [Acipenser sinensis]
MQKRAEAVVMRESIWGPVAAHKGSGRWLLVMRGLSPALPLSGPGESGGDGSDQAVAAELPRTGKEANGSAGLASSDAMALPSAESSRPEEDDPCSCSCFSARLARPGPPTASAHSRESAARL